MAAKTLHIVATYHDQGVLATREGKLIPWSNLTRREDPGLPFGTRVEISLQYEELRLYHGDQGIVWATYDQAQAETIQNALLVQKIFSEIHPLPLEHRKLMLVYVPKEEDRPAAIDFIWRDQSGMRLQPDWHYPLGTANLSYQKWLEAR